MPAKLKIVRQNRHLTMDEMARNLEREVELLGYRNIRIQSGHISEYEQGKREPLLPVLLAYSKIFRVNLNIIVDNSKELPGFVKGKANPDSSE